ncbi:MAG: hypothetical protein ACLFQ0_12870 [Cyclobacteriaceae bacterium]
MFEEGSTTSSLQLVSENMQGIISARMIFAKMLLFFLICLDSLDDGKWGKGLKSVTRNISFP